MPDQGAETPIRLTVTLPPKLIGIMLAVWAAFVAAFIIYPAYRAAIVFGASSLGGLGALAGAFYLARGLILTAQQQEDAMRRKEMENAFRYLERWNNPVFHHLKIAAGRVIEIQEKQGAEAVTDELNKDAIFRSNVTDVLNFFEEIAIAINSKIVDEKTLRRAYRGLIHMYCMALEDFVVHRRQKFSNPRLFVEVENLHKRWSKNLS